MKIQQLNLLEKTEEPTTEFTHVLIGNEFVLKPLGIKSTQYDAIVQLNENTYYAQRKDGTKHILQKREVKHEYRQQMQ